MSHRFIGNDNKSRLFRLFSSTAKALLGAATFVTLCAAAPANAANTDDGPYADITEADMNAMGASDAGFQTLFSSWKKMDDVTRAAVYIPSGRPVDKLSLTSNYGVRSDPFNGRARMHKGIDIPGPVGTPIYATADGIVARSGWVNGYGNMVEITHGNGMETRYGHMSKLIVEPNSRVRRGQIIGLMGSTGRSTGSHLHYEVRVDGAAINPLPFVAGADYMVAMNTKPPLAVGGPTSREEKAAN
ncbi:M23 family metallopeptidase [Sphingobium aquiterrae]|uniref:M23 family metallopeptidase n=1 Tax=Sphingobium aquiterrae TaxID=2038656 RepID=UPI003AFAD514